MGLHVSLGECNPEHLGFWALDCGVLEKLWRGRFQALGNLGVVKFAAYWEGQGHLHRIGE